MKHNIHPTYHPEAKIVCACGNTIVVGSTAPEMRVEICAACHPFYTGQEKLVDTQGRVEKFRARAAQAKSNVRKVQKTRKEKAASKA